MIVIDAGVSDAHLVPLTTIPSGALTARLIGAGTVTVPAEVLGGSALVTVPGDLSKGWPVRDGKVVVTDSTGATAAEAEVRVIRRTAGRMQIEQAAAAAIAANNDAIAANNAGIQVIDQWLAGAMPTTVAGCVTVLRTLAQQNKAAARHRNGIAEELNVLIRLALENYDT